MGKYELKDYDIWFEKCKHCGYDPGRVSDPSPNTCWKCGRRLIRDYSDRALKREVRVSQMTESEVNDEKALV